MKSSFVKCLEHIDEFPGQLPFSPLSFIKSIYFFLHFLVSSSSNSITCRTIPFYISEKAAHSSTSYLQLLVHSKSKCFVDEIPGRRHKLVSSQSLNCSFLYSIWQKTAYFGGFCRLVKTKRNMEYDLFLRKAS